MRDRGWPLQVLTPGEVDYRTAWGFQRELVTARAEAGGPDTVLLLTHPPVYTAGKRTRPADRPVDGTPVIDVDRGGEITWHGPGQLVGYPIVKLAEPVDVVGYVRVLEEALMACCADLGLSEVGRVAGRSGVWLPAREGLRERKIAAIGARVTRGVTMHGFALNCDVDLAWYDRIVPCGISDADVTSLSAELGRHVPVEEVLPYMRDRLIQAINGELAVTERNIGRHIQDAVTIAPGITWQLDPKLANTLVTSASGASR